MTTTLGHVAQILMDDFYQGYAPQDAFFGIEHFMFKVASAYARVFKEEFTLYKRINKSETGFSYVVMPPHWLIYDDVEVKEVDGDRVAILPCPVFCYSYDSYTSGVQSASPMPKSCDLIRIVPHERWTYDEGIMPVTSKGFYFVQMSAPQGDQCAADTMIVLLGRCAVKRVRVFYVPAVNPEDINSPMSIEVADMILPKLLQEQLIAKKEVVIDKTLDQNRNAVPATEINQDSMPKK